MPTIRFTNRLDRHVDCPQEKVAGETVVMLGNVSLLISLTFIRCKLDE